jgi:hypothetical protein
MDFQAYFKNKNLTKVPREGLHFEQKTTPDLIWCVALAIEEITQVDPQRMFSDSDIRQSRAFGALMQDYFSKAPQSQAKNEYNKLSSYQLGLLAFAGVLVVEGKPKRYRVVEADIVAFLATNDLNSLRFLSEYTEKFLVDNGLLSFFEIYKNNPNQDNHLKAKQAYWDWARVNTGVRGTDRKHTYRVFNKLFNIYCNKHRIPGESGSNITLGPCPYSLLIYNRTNFRDKDMPIGMTRSQYKVDVLSKIETDGYVETLLQKAKESVRSKYNDDSEIKDPNLGYLPNQGTHVHHILPKSSYPEFSLTKENLICLSPGQHLSLAHVMGDTRQIDPGFQRECLKQKFKNIWESIKAGENFYELTVFIRILNTCLCQDVDEDSSPEEVGIYMTTI